MSLITSYEIRGRMVALPVHVRDADTWAAQFLVPAAAAQDIVDPTGLEVAQLVPGRAVVNIAFVRYRDTDLDAYNEVAIAFLVRPDSSLGAGRRDRAREFLRGEIGVYIHRLPVTESFTLEAGRTIWGFPKFLASIDIAEEGRHVSCTLAHEGVHILTLKVRDGGRIRLPQRPMPTYSLLDDVLRRTEFQMRSDDAGARLGGAKLELGPHEIADELRSLGLPKHAVMTSTMRDLTATFERAEEV